MTETTESLDNSATAPATKGRARKGEGLSGMVLTDLKALAGQLGIRGTSGMRKGDLVAAIAARQNGAGAAEGGATGGAARSTGRRQSADATNGHASSDPTLPLGDTAAARRAYEQALRTLDLEDNRHERMLQQIDPGDIATACRARLRALREEF